MCTVWNSIRTDEVNKHVKYFRKYLTWHIFSVASGLKLTGTLGNWMGCILGAQHCGSVFAPWSGKRPIRIPPNDPRREVLLVVQKVWDDPVKVVVHLEHDLAGHTSAAQVFLQIAPWQIFHFSGCNLWCQPRGRRTLMVSVGYFLWNLSRHFLLCAIIVPPNASWLMVLQ